ncbi:hypothetical protein PHJA_002111100 [Phtheirospermum japonicum]|uniref:Uncharacterized protein n=1 Tax=Phtheirospermum japonicum TaxID=374723 RepID=A0A830CIU4_9LAMI|nr:hypothetical protein PHJA_002111100 [Phtheirospermum japonicum]
MEKSERRKKIISRGTDRMALITGRIQSLDPDPFLKSTSFSTSRRDPPTALHARSSSEPGAADQEALIPDEIHYGGDDEPDTVSRHYKEISERNDSDIRVPRLEKREASRFKPEYAHLPEKQHPGCIFSSITPNEINFSIISSEDTRVICSVVLAILVVLSYIALPNNDVKPKSLIAYKPLYVVVLTNVFIVAAKLAPYAQIKKECYKEPMMTGDEDGDNWGGAVKLLELGLVLHQTIRAIFIDCSFYLVVVVCGLSMSRSRKIAND